MKDLSRYIDEGFFQNVGGAIDLDKSKKELDDLIYLVNKYAWSTDPSQRSAHMEALAETRKLIDELPCGTIIQLNNDRSLIKINAMKTTKIKQPVWINFFHNIYGRNDLDDIIKKELGSYRLSTERSSDIITDLEHARRHGIKYQLKFMEVKDNY